MKSDTLRTATGQGTMSIMDGIEAYFQVMSIAEGKISPLGLLYLAQAIHYGYETGGVEFVQSLEFREFSQVYVREASKAASALVVQELKPFLYAWEKAQATAAPSAEVDTPPQTS